VPISSAARQPLTTQAHGSATKGARNNTAGARRGCSNLRETLVPTKNAGAHEKRTGPVLSSSATTQPLTTQAHTLNHTGP
jgi:hypothetical protein